MGEKWIYCHALFGDASGQLIKKQKYSCMYNVHPYTHIYIYIKPLSVI